MSVIFLFLLLTHPTLVFLSYLMSVSQICRFVLSQKCYFQEEEEGQEEGEGKGRSETVFGARSSGGIRSGQSSFLQNKGRTRI